jgi:hypothetical protein
VHVCIETLHELHESRKRSRDELTPPLFANLMVLVAQGTTEAVCRTSIFRSRTFMGVHI